MSFNWQHGLSRLDENIRTLQQRLTIDTQASLDVALGRALHPNAVNIEDAETVKVGETYFVNVVTTRKDSPGVGASFPILGDEHSDADYISVFPDNVPHYHIDWRFIPDNLYPPLVKMLVEVFGQYEAGWNAETHRNMQLAVVLPASVMVGCPQRWPLPVFRQQLRWEAYPDWLPLLEQAYKDKRACDNVCPHRGISLTGAPADQNGVRVCPGHGLAWDRDGCLVQRKK